MQSSFDTSPHDLPQLEVVFYNSHPRAFSNLYASHSIFQLDEFRLSLTVSSRASRSENERLMRGLEVESPSWLLADVERAYPALQSDVPPDAGALFFESAIALAVPLLLALVADFWLSAGGGSLP